ncbi:MAG: cell division ATP-binding protein FtsE [Proteobacteria bacterium]|nr:MAG: cell division ATP-binding protein FtsE [Pseudomonadota bacterium]PIE17214.1 MAG: cell division ATP-binding protein FtsE [Pseudomonadota bacterium]
MSRECPVIQLFDVTKVFDGRITALRDVTLRVDKGELVLLTGPSGAGKTTMLRTIFAAERPNKGQIVIAGRNISRLRRSSIPYLRRNIGVVFQDFKLLQNRSALQNVGIALEICGRRRREVRRKAAAALALVGLEADAHKQVCQLSGGEQQRVAIARAVVGNPSILLADEPTGNLDPERSHDILDLLDGIAQAGTAVLLATHDPMVVQNAASTQIIRLENGHITQVLPGLRAPLDAPPMTAERPSRATPQPGERVATPPLEALRAGGTP